MGSGTEKWEEIAADLDDRFPGQFKAVLSFKGQEKYRTYAAADFAMMPSRLVCVCVCVCVHICVGDCVWGGWVIPAWCVCVCVCTRVRACVRACVRA